LKCFIYIQTEDNFFTTTNSKSEAKQMDSTFKKYPNFKELIKKSLNESEERIARANQSDIACINDKNDEQALKKDNELKHLMIKLMQIEKLMFLNILNHGNKIIYPRLLLKYDELLNEIYYITGELVNMGAFKTQEYIEYCNKSVKTRNFVKLLCEFAEENLQ